MQCFCSCCHDLFFTDNCLTIRLAFLFIFFTVQTSSLCPKVTETIQWFFFHCLDNLNWLLYYFSQAENSITSQKFKHKSRSLSSWVQTSFHLPRIEVWIWETNLIILPDSTHPMTNYYLVLLENIFSSCTGHFLWYKRISVLSYFYAISSKYAALNLIMILIWLLVLNELMNRFCLRFFFFCQEKN